jgi:hypothetical protein
VLSRAAAVTAILGSKVAAPREIEQGRDAMPGDQVDASAAAAVPTVGSAERHELFATERDDAIAAIPSLYPDMCFVDVNRHVYQLKT